MSVVCQCLPAGSFSTSRCRTAAAPVVLLFLLGCFLELGRVVPAQAQTLESRISSNAAGASAGSLPFWLSANRRGTVDGRSANALVLTGASLAGTLDARELTYSVGGDVITRYSQRPTAAFHQLYGRLAYRSVRFTVGRINHSAGIVDTSLSAGSMMWSENAAPLPRISISVPDFQVVPGTRGYLSFKGYLAHGWFETDRYVRRPSLHEKYLYLRLLPRSFSVNGYAGVVHNSMWRGVHPDRGRLHTGFRAFANTFFGRRSNVDATTAELGNTVAMYDFGLGYSLGPIRGLAYRHFYIEDEPALWFRSPWDGVWGMSAGLKGDPKLIEKILWEHVRTLRQGSKYSEGEPGGADNYYNHGMYYSGWTYQGRTIGSPLMFASRDAEGVANNRLIAHHVGLAGSLPLQQISYRFFLTYSRNYGAKSVFVDSAGRRQPARTERQDQYSYLLELSGPLVTEYPVSFNLSFAVDSGEVHPDNVGIMLGVRSTNISRLGR